MSSDEDNGKTGKNGSTTFVKLRTKKQFPEWKRKTLALARQQGYSRFLERTIDVLTETEIEDLKTEIEVETDADKKKEKKLKLKREQQNSKLSTTASCMLTLAMPESVNKKLEDVKNDPKKMFEVICAKYDKKGNNKLSNLTKQLTRCRLRKTSREPDDWFIDLQELNCKIEQINPQFKMTDVQLSMHIMTNLCEEYEMLD